MTAAEFFVWHITMKGSIGSSDREVSTARGGVHSKRGSEEAGGSIPHLVAEEVFWKIKSQGEYRKQEPPDPDCCMTGVRE